ncbi:hypothetical protein N7501_009519 [Penicillium viridicatum]|nr:hypothetical protein N7501_009519 [Penicillium viridicatum]
MGEQTEVKSTLVLGVFLNSGSETEKALRHVTLHEALDDKALADVRSLLFKGGQLTAEQARYPFCSKDGGSVPENTKFSVYSSMLAESGEIPKKLGEKDEKEPAKTVENPKVILKKETIWTDLDERTQQFLGDKSNLNYRENRAALLDDPLTKLSSSYDHKNYAAAVSKTTAVHPADMTEQNWDAVMRTNNVLSGQSITTSKFGSNASELTTIERGVYTAFQLKSREFEPYQISYASLEKIGGKQSLKIPRFRVVDGSSVSVYETKTSLASALAKGSFSETVVEASAGGGFFGVSAAAKIGFTDTEENSNASKQSSAKDVMHISYNFPRVVLHLEVESLELSDECKESLLRVKSREDVFDFYKQFGSFFARRVELGGRLHSEQESSECSGSTVSQKSQSMKVAASASFSSSFAQASASASHERQSNSKDSNENSSLQSSITWEAQGGDTLLCNNPAAWCPTVASFYTWRVMKQDDICSIVDMIGMIKDYSWVPRKFAEAVKHKKRLQFRMNAKERHGSKVEGCLGLSMSGPRDQISVSYKDSTPTQREQGHIINHILKFSPLCRLQSASAEGSYFEIRDADFRGIDDSRLVYKKLYRLYNPYFKCWLAATDDLRPHTYQRFLYGGNIENAALFHLETPGHNKLEGNIEDDHDVELCMSNEDKKYLGMATLLDTFNWVDYIGLQDYTDDLYKWIVYTKVEYAP